MEDQRQIMDKTAAEGKGGPRIHNVVSEIIDQNWIYQTVSITRLYFTKMMFIRIKLFRKLLITW
jgi:hypothetical protein